MRRKGQRPVSTATDGTSLADPGTEEKTELDGKPVRGFPSELEAPINDRDEALTPELATEYTSPRQTSSSDGLTPSPRGRGHSGPGLSESGGAPPHEMPGQYNPPELEGDPIVHELPGSTYWVRK